MQPRKGSVYIVILLASLIVASMALASIETMRWYSRDLHEEADLIHAQMAADTGFELALGRLNNDSNWRTNHAHNVDSRPIAIDTATIRYRLIDEDGDLSDDESDRCDLLVTAEVGNARRAWQATLVPAGDALDCLSYVAATDGTLELFNHSLMATDHAVASNLRIYVKNWAYLTADCFSTGSMTGNIYGSLNTLSTPVTIPGVSALDHYVEMGTAIDINVLPKSGNRYTLENHLLSTSSNTVTGNLNPDGVYVIDCLGQEINIKNCRLQCTLVLVNPKFSSIVSESVHWEAAKANYPILLVNGSIRLALDRNPLAESTVGTNFNPPGTPYRGVSDANTSTVYPSQLRGLIYASGAIETYSECEIFGAVVANSLTNYGDVLLRYRDIYANQPPPGFATSDRILVVPGSFQRILPP